MSSTVESPKDKHPLPLGDILRDLALIRAADIDLQAIVDDQDVPNSNAADEVDMSVKQSYEFVKEARAALKINNKGDLERIGTMVECIRDELDEVLTVLGASSHE
jgi:hypothetical protein